MIKTTPTTAVIAGNAQSALPRPRAHSDCEKANDDHGEAGPERPGFYIHQRLPAGSRSLGTLIGREPATAPRAARAGGLHLDAWFITVP
jgi:hypothetical protein